MNPRRFLILVVTVWLAAQIGNILISGFIAWSSISDEFLEQNQKIAELVSNRLAHHEAIIGSLKALTRGTSDKIFQRLTSNVFKNYPRIQSVKIYRFDSRSYSAKPELLYEAPSKSPAFPMSVLNALPRQETNIVRVYDAPAIPNHYLSTMVANNRQGLIAVVLLIDSTKLFDLPPASYPPEINLTLNDVLVFGSTDHDNGRHDHEKDISSILKNALYADLDWDRSGYRFKIHAHRPIEFGELVTLPEVIRFALLSLAAILRVSYGRYQTLVSWQSKQAEEKAIKRSAMLEHENRLSHAARVNQVGELASGIIHELTQPLSALLSHKSKPTWHLLSKGTVRIAFTHSIPPRTIATAICKCFQRRWSQANAPILCFCKFQLTLHVCWNCTYLLSKTLDRRASSRTQDGNLSFCLSIRSSENRNSTFQADASAWPRPFRAENATYLSLGIGFAKIRILF